MIGLELMANLYLLRSTPELDCQNIFQFSGNAFEMRYPSAPIYTIDDSLDLLPGGFVVQSETFQPSDLYVQASVCRHWQSREKVGSKALRFMMGQAGHREVNGNYLISELRGSTATLVPEELVQEEPEKFLTQRLKDLSSLIPLEKIMEYDIGYLVNVGE